MGNAAIVSRWLRRHLRPIAATGTKNGGHQQQPTGNTGFHSHGPPSQYLRFSSVCPDSAASNGHDRRSDYVGRLPNEQLSATADATENPSVEHWASMGRQQQHGAIRASIHGHRQHRADGASSVADGEAAATPRAARSDGRLRQQWAARVRTMVITSIWHQGRTAPRCSWSMSSSNRACFCGSTKWLSIDPPPQCKSRWEPGLDQTLGPPRAICAG